MRMVLLITWVLVGVIALFVLLVLVLLLCFIYHTNVWIINVVYISPHVVNTLGTIFGRDEYCVV